MLKYIVQKIDFFRSINVEYSIYIQYRITLHAKIIQNDSFYKRLCHVIAIGMLCVMLCHIIGTK